MKRAILALAFTLAAVLLTAASCNPLIKTTTVTPAGVTNTVTTINQSVLLADEAVAEAAGTFGLSALVVAEPDSVPILEDIDLALAGILNGASSNDVATVIAAVPDRYAALAPQITQALGAVSALEQRLLAKYGQVNAVAISVAVATVLDTSIKAALATVK